jgi:hypothetical protein
VALADIHDGPVQNAVAGLKEGAFVACRVLPGEAMLLAGHSVVPTLSRSMAGSMQAIFLGCMRA